MKFRQEVVPRHRNLQTGLTLTVLDAEAQDVRPYKSKINALQPLPC